MVRVRNAFLWSFVSRYLSIAAQLVAVILVARLLTPEEIGVFSIASAVFGLVHLFSQFWCQPVCSEA